LENDGLTIEEKKNIFLSNIENELLFQVITKDEDGRLKTFKIYVGGKVEVFGKNYQISNKFHLLTYLISNFQFEKKS
jgi:hypothetical protein